MAEDLFVFYKFCIRPFEYAAFGTDKNPVIGHGDCFDSFVHQTVVIKFLHYYIIVINNNFPNCSHLFLKYQNHPQK